MQDHLEARGVVVSLAVQEVDVQVARDSGGVVHEAAREARVSGGGRPVPALAASLAGRGQKRAQDDAVGAAGHGLGDLGGVDEVAVGQKVHVAPAGLIQVVPARGRGIRHGGGQGHVDPDGLRVGIHAAAHDDAGRAGSHQVQGRGVVRHAAGDDRHVQGTDEFLEVQRLAAGADVLGGDQGALDKQQFRAGRDDHRSQLTGVLRGHAHRYGHARLPHLADALGEQVRVQIRAVEAL